MLGGAAVAQQESPCPGIQLNVPLNLDRGKVVNVDVEIDGDVPSKAEFVWRVSVGQIIEGQGTNRIKLLLDETYYDSITIEFEIKGLSDECPNMVSESVITCYVDPVLIDEFSLAVDEIARERLEDAAHEQRNNPADQLYIIEYFEPSTSEFSIREKLERIKRFLTDELQFDISAVTVVTAEANQPWTKIYRVPPGGETPRP